MKEKTKHTWIFALTLTYLCYIIVTFLINKGSVFRYYWYVPTILLSGILSGGIKLNIIEDDKLFNIIIRFGNVIITVLLILLAFVLIDAKEVIASTMKKNALMSISWLSIFLFVSYILAIIGKNLKQKKEKEMYARVAFYMFLMSFLILISFIGSLTF